MVAEPAVFEGVVRDNVVVPLDGARLRDGTRVRVLVPGPHVPVELASEFEAWERASDEAWGMIDQWERSAGT